jgi:hypothetical protein
MKMINELAAAGIVDSACIRYAEGHGIAEELARRGIMLASCGERLATLLREGYLPLTFLTLTLVISFKSKSKHLAHAQVRCNSRRRRRRAVYSQ